MNEIVRLREKIGMSREQFARRCNIPTSTLQKLETGKNDNSGAKVETIKKIADAFNLPMTALIDLPNGRNYISSQVYGLQVQIINYLEEEMKKIKTLYMHLEVKEQAEKFVIAFKEIMEQEYGYKSTKANDLLLDLHLQRLYNFNIENFPTYIECEVDTETNNIYGGYNISYHGSGNDKRINNETRAASNSLLTVLNILVEEVIFEEVSNRQEVQKTVERKVYNGEIQMENIIKFIESNFADDNVSGICEKIEAFLKGCTQTPPKYLEDEMLYLCMKEETTNYHKYVNGIGTSIKMKKLLGICL